MNKNYNKVHKQIQTHKMNMHLISRDSFILFDSVNFPYTIDILGSLTVIASSLVRLTRLTRLVRLTDLLVDHIASAYNLIGSASENKSNIGIERNEQTENDNGRMGHSSGAQIPATDRDMNESIN